MNEATGNVADPGSMTLVLNNGESSVQPGVVGRYSPKNPRSDLYGKIGRNTPIRVSAAVGDAPLSTRFVGEVVTWPPRWDVSEADRWVALEAAGVLRRLGVPGRPLRSALHRFITSSDPVGYWPLQDPPLSTHARAVVGNDLTLTGFSTTTDQIARGWSEGQTFPWLGAAYRVRENNFFRTFASIGPPGNLNALAADVVYMHQPGEAVTITLQLRTDNESGDAITWGYVVFPGGVSPPTTRQEVPNDAEIQVFTSGDVSFTATGVSSVLSDGRPHHVRLQLTQSGSNVEVALYVDGEAVTLSASSVNATLGSAQRGMTLGTGVNITSGSVDVNYLAVWYDDDIPDINDVVKAAFGHSGETAGHRVSRLCSEEGVTLTTVGDLDACTPMGPQRPLRLLELLSECATAEAAGARLPILTETRDSLGLTFRTRQSFYIT